MERKDYLTSLVVLVLVGVFLVFGRDPIFTLWKSNVASVVKKGLADIPGYGIITFAALAGVLSVISTSAYPYLPGFLAYQSAVMKAVDRSKKLKLAALSGIGAIAISVLFGVGVALLGKGLIKTFIPLKPIMGGVVVFLGLAMISGRLMGSFSGMSSSLSANNKCLLSGMGYSIACLPCKIAIFGGLTAYVLATGNLYLGALSFFVYSATFSIGVFGASALSVKFGGDYLNKYGGHAETAMKMGGLILVMAGIYLIYLYLAFGV